MDVKFKIENQIISRTDRVRVVADSKNYLRAVFAFTPEWGGLTKTAIFGNNNNYYEMLLDGDACMVPAEVIKPPYFSVSVVAGDRITANIATVDVIASGYREGETPAEPTPDVYAQIIANMEQQAVDAERAEDAQHAAEGARDDAQGYAEQTERDKQTVAQDKSNVAADRRAVDDALTEFATVTLPAAVQTVGDKADAEVIRVEQTGDAQVEAIELSGAEQIAAAKEQADLAKASELLALAYKLMAVSYAIGGTGERPGEETDNAKYYKDAAIQAFTDLLAMMGTHIATLTDGKLTPSQIPALSINDVFPVVDTTAMLTLTAERGDVALIMADDVVTDSYILAADEPTVAANWKKLGVSYVANAGHANTADNAANADRINNKRIVGMTQSQYDAAALDDETYYFVVPEA